MFGVVERTNVGARGASLACPDQDRDWNDSPLPVGVMLFGR